MKQKTIKNKKLKEQVLNSELETSVPAPMFYLNKVYSDSLLAFVYDRLNQKNKAEGSIALAIAAAPDQPEPHLNVAQLFLKYDKMDDVKN
jgi:hypothetical protein